MTRTETLPTSPGASPGLGRLPQVREIWAEPAALDSARGRDVLTRSPARG